MLFPNWVVILAICCGSLVIANQVQSYGETKVNEETQSLNEELLSHEETQINEAWLSPPGSQMYVRRNVDPATEDDVHSARATKPDQNLKINKVANKTKTQMNPPYSNTAYRSGYGFGGAGYSGTAGYGGGGYTKPFPTPTIPGPAPAPAPVPGGYGPLIGQIGSSDLLMAGLFFQDKCLGLADLMSGYIPLFTFNKANVCARVFKSLTPVGPVQTVTSKNAVAIVVNQVKILATDVELRGSQVIVVVVALVFEGPAQGKYVAVRALFEFPSLYRLCSGLLGNPSLASIDAVMVISDVPTLDIIDCHGSRKSCFEKVRNKKQLECTGKIFLS